ncbi:glycosyltransferase family 2 protein [Spirosoma harenae]
MDCQLSIITINLNNDSGLKKTIESVICQSFIQFEFIIIDGGSTDNSLHILDQYADKITYWISEADNGIYHAMNKGIRHAKGNYCLFLNSGDWLVSYNTLENVFATKPTADIISGNIYYYDNENGQVKWLVRSPEKITAKDFFFNTLPHQATFIKKSLFDTISLYNENLKIASDWLFFLEAILVRNSSYFHYQDAVAYFNMDGISCDPATNMLPRQEQLSVLREKYPLFLSDYERFDKLERQSQHWLESREYKVYKFLERTGIIRLGVFCRRLKRGLQRTILSLF